jgi:tRNA(Arg) A34 adenosine deaminase TadA
MKVFSSTIMNILLGSHSLEEGNIVKKAAKGFSKPLKQYNTPSLHAEVSALKNFYKKYSKNEYVKMKVDLYVIRISQSGKLVSSRPCFHCLRTLARSKINIRYVYYSVNETIMKEKFNSMMENELTEISYGMRK